MARRLGATDDDLDGALTGRLQQFPDGWRAAFQAAEEITTGRGELPESTFQTLVAHWTPGQIVEIVSVVALFNLFNRFATSLHVPVTR
ncbi:MAG TPA: hypothetical protein VFK13_13860 [Gemmatimonadaceae bacterium]|nr:hypothetical protein [Gemmatimonadaceae bacterium]